MGRLPLVSPVDRVLFLKAQSYLEGVPSEVFSTLAEFTEEEFHPADSWARKSGDSVDRILFLAEGAVEIQRGGAPPQLVEAPGAIGLVDWFAQAESPPGVRAAVDTLCLAIATPDLEAILEDQFALLHRFAARGNEEVVELMKALGPLRPDEPGFEGPRSDTPVVLDLVHRLAWARRAPLLRRANLTMLGELVRSEDPAVIAKGEALWHAGDPVDRMALVLDGCFCTDGRCGEARAPAGALIGVWEALTEGLHFEGWLAEKASRVLWIRRELFIDLLEDHYELASDYLQQQSERIIDAWTRGGARI